MTSETWLIKGVDDLKKAKQWHDDEWRFLLPLGLPLANYKSVQLLHFPPIAVLTCFQDYLKVATTVRSAEMLELNGASGTDLYQASPISPPLRRQRRGKQLGQNPADQTLPVTEPPLHHL